MADEMDFSPDLISLLDEDGVEHQFEYVDTAEIDGQEYVALIPVAEHPEEVLEADGELVILRIEEEDGEEFLAAIEEEEEFNHVANIFMDRLDDLYEITEE